MEKDTEEIKDVVTIEKKSPLHEFVEKYEAEISEKPINEDMLNCLVSKTRLKMGPQLRSYLLEFGYIKFGNLRFYGAEQIPVPKYEPEIEENVEEKICEEVGQEEEVKEKPVISPYLTEFNLFVKTTRLKEKYPRQVGKLYAFARLSNGISLYVDSEDYVYSGKGVNDLTNTKIKFSEYILDTLKYEELMASHDKEWRRNYERAKIVYNFMNFEEEYRSDRDMAMVAVKSDGRSLEYVGENLKHDKELQLEALAQSTDAFKALCKFIQEDIDYVKQKMIENKGGLEYASNIFKDDKKFVLKLVSENGKELAFVSERLKQDKDVCEVAVEQDIGAFGFVKNKEVLDDKECIKKYIQINPKAYEKLNQKWREDKEIASIALSEYGELLQFAGNDLKDDNEIVQIALNSKYKDLKGRGISKDPLTFASKRLQEELKK